MCNSSSRKGAKPQTSGQVSQEYIYALYVLLETKDLEDILEEDAAGGVEGCFPPMHLLTWWLSGFAPFKTGHVVGLSSQQLAPCHVVEIWHSVVANRPTCKPDLQFSIERSREAQSCGSRCLRL